MFIKTMQSFRLFFSTWSIYPQERGTFSAFIFLCFLGHPTTAPPRTIRKRSYKNFNQQLYLEDVSAIDFRGVYSCLEVDEAASLLTQKLVDVLDRHAPLIVYQQRKYYTPWLSSQTLENMKKRGKFKEQAKELAKSEGQYASPEQIQLWRKYRKLRNSIHNKVG